MRVSDCDCGAKASIVCRTRSNAKSVAARPGHERGVRRALFPRRHCDAPMQIRRRCRRVGKGAKRRAHDSSRIRRRIVGTLSLCPPYEIAFVARNSSRTHAQAASRRMSPELCLISSPSIGRGRREDREPAGTRGPLCEVVVEVCTAAYRCSQDIPAFPAQWLYGLCRTLLGERCTIAPVALPMTDARARSGRYITARLDASLRAPGPHDFAVRRSHRSYAPGVSLTVARPAKPLAPM